MRGASVKQLLHLANAGSNFRTNEQFLYRRYKIQRSSCCNNSPPISIYILTVCRKPTSSTADLFWAMAAWMIAATATVEGYNSLTFAEFAGGYTVARVRVINFVRAAATFDGSTREALDDCLGGISVLSLNVT
jgi:hypothetical protein